MGEENFLKIQSLDFLQTANRLSLAKERRANNRRLPSSFTLIEVLVTISIIAILTGIFFVNYRSGQQQFTLQRAANKLAQDIRRTEAMAIESKKCSPPPVSCPSGGGVPAGGYGFYVDKSSWPDRYFIYADNSAISQCYNLGEAIETIYLEKGVIIKDLNPGNPSFSVNFLPPDPTINFKYQDCTDIIQNSVIITIALETDNSKTKTITVNKAGLVEID